MPGQRPFITEALRGQGASTLAVQQSRRRFSWLSGTSRVTPWEYPLVDASSVPFTVLSCFLRGPWSSRWLSPASTFTDRPLFSHLPVRGEAPRPVEGGRTLASDKLGLKPGSFISGNSPTIPGTLRPQSKHHRHSLPG